MSPYLKKKKKNAHYFNMYKNVYLLMFTGEVIVKFLLCCITDNGL